MKSDELLDAIGEARDEYVDDVRNQKKKKMPKWAKWTSAIAVCLAIVIGINLILGGMGGIAGNGEALSAPYLFASFEDFEKHEKGTGENAELFYYIPSALTQNYELSQITKRDDVYVMMEYTLSSNQALSAEKLSEYDAERLSTLIFRYSLYSVTQEDLEESFIRNGYEPIEYEGKVYYCWDEYAENNPDKQIIGYEIAFLEDGRLFFMHLPAVDTFENMMKFTNIVKVNIKEAAD